MDCPGEYILCYCTSYYSELLSRQDSLSEMTEPIDNISPSKLTNKLQTLPTSEDCTSNHI